MSKKPFPNPLPCLYAQLMPKLREVAKAKGYALGLHGSMLRDLDLIAAPWVEACSSDRELIEAMAAACEGFIVGANIDGVWTAAPTMGDIRPHGRRSWNICFGGAPFIDVSVMTRSMPPAGHLIDDQGMTRRIAGELPVSADGVVLGVGAKIWPAATHYVLTDDPEWDPEDEAGIVEFGVRHEVVADGWDPEHVYSSHEAAKAATEHRSESGATGEGR